MAWRHDKTTYSVAYGHETLFTADEGNVQTDLVDLTVTQALANQYLASWRNLEHRTRLYILAR